MVSSDASPPVRAVVGLMTGGALYRCGSRLTAAHCMLALHREGAPIRLRPVFGRDREFEVWPSPAAHAAERLCE